MADFQAVDGDVTLLALLAYLTAEEEESKGLEVVAPSAADSVKLLTVHRAKGLEWASVFLAGVCAGRFPSSQSRTLWTSSPAVLPAPLRGDAADLPQLGGYDKAALDALPRRHQGARGAGGAAARLRRRHPGRALALGDVVLLEPAAERRSVRRPTRCSSANSWRSGARPSTDWLRRPGQGRPQPLRRRGPLETLAAHRDRRGGAAAARRGRDGARRRPRPRTTTSTWSRVARVADWDAEVERLLVEARAERSAEIAVPLPGSLSATALLRLQDDPDAFAQELARPMPRPPSRAARFGTLFHAWVEDRFKQQPLLDPDDLPGRADLDIEDEGDLDTVIEAFEKGPFADRVPHAVEAPFALVLAGQVVRGRIDAVYDEPATGGVPARRLEDQPPRGRRPAPARALPAGLGRAPRRTAREGARRVPLRAHRQDRRARRTCRTVRRWRPLARSA